MKTKARAVGEPLVGALRWMGGPGGHPASAGPLLPQPAAATKLKERSGNVYENKGALRKDGAERWNGVGWPMHGSLSLHFAPALCLTHTAGTMVMSKLNERTLNVYENKGPACGVHPKTETDKIGTHFSEWNGGVP